MGTVAQGLEFKDALTILGGKQVQPDAQATSAASAFDTPAAADLPSAQVQLSSQLIPALIPASGQLKNEQLEEEPLLDFSDLVFDEEEEEEQEQQKEEPLLDFSDLVFEEDPIVEGGQGSLMQQQTQGHRQQASRRQRSPKRKARTPLPTSPGRQRVGPIGGGGGGGGAGGAALSPKRPAPRSPPKSPLRSPLPSCKYSLDRVSACIVMTEDATGTPWPARVGTQAERRKWSHYSRDTVRTKCGVSRGWAGRMYILND